MKDNENIFVLGIVLFLITALAALLLAYCNSVTIDKINSNAIIEQDNGRREVIPDANEFTKLEIEAQGMVQEIYEAKSNGESVGYCVSVSPNGYSGNIDMIVGILKDHSIAGIKIVSMSETPGLGAKAADAGFASQYSGKSTEKEIKVIKSGTAKEDEVVAISGATVTTNAVTKGVNTAMEAVLSLE